MLPPSADRLIFDALHRTEPATVCAWCPTFDRTDPAHAGASHGICPTCVARVEAQLVARQPVVR